MTKGANHGGHCERIKCGDADSLSEPTFSSSFHGRTDSSSNHRPAFTDRRGGGGGGRGGGGGGRQVRQSAPEAFGTNNHGSGLAPHEDLPEGNCSRVDEEGMVYALNQSNSKQVAGPAGIQGAGENNSYKFSFGFLPHPHLYRSNKRASHEFF